MFGNDYTTKKATSNGAKRILRVNQLIKRELSQILLKEVDLPKGALITITRVEASLDLNQARVYISVMPARNASRSDAGGPENQSTCVLEILKRQIYDLQQKLNKRLKMRPLPRILFTKEKRTSEAGRVEELLEEIHKQK